VPRATGGTAGALSTPTGKLPVLERHVPLSGRMVFLAVGWLRSDGVLKDVKGRGHYVPGCECVTKAAGAAFEELPSR
jgi:hypothetical protein